LTRGEGATSIASLKEVPTSLEKLAGLALAALVLSACEKPPVKELAAAEAAVSQARTDDTERYAPERLKDAQAALAEAQRKVQEKDFRGAIAAAADATEKARSAPKVAASAKTVAQTTTQVLQAEVRAALDEVGAIREEAAKARVPDKAFQELEGQREAAERALQTVSDLAGKGELLGAQKAATELRAQVAALPGLFRDALDAWQTSHGRKPRVKK
jgi:hypothetical protein